jgi:hypothetical protein
MAFYHPAADGAPQYFCAKRASASVRSAALLEAEMERADLGFATHDHGAVDELLEQPLPQAAAARLRRDARVCQQQRCTPVSCGKQPMAVTPLLGRVVRVQGRWWSICSLCGVVVRWHPGSFFGAEPCCMHCDTTLVRPGEALRPPEVKRTFCRFCGKPSDASSGAAHRTYRAPHDISGANATTPPPLRRVSFCAAHQRTWLAAALRQLSTAVVLAHIAHAARPVLSTETARRNAVVARASGVLINDDEGADAEPVAGKRRKRARERKLPRRQPSGAARRV